MSVLNYAPGPLDTRMVDTLKSDGHMQEQFKATELLKPETTVLRLIQILEGNKFKSGDHVDYFDSS